MLRRLVPAAVVALALASGPAHAQIMDRIKINGYGSLEFEKQLEAKEKGKGDPNGSFDADAFDLVINVLPTDKIRVAADVTWEHGATTEADRGNVALEYAFVEYVHGDWFKVRGGKMFVPFGQFNEIHTAKPLFLTVKEPYSTDKVDKLGSPIRFFPRWGAGLAILGGGQVGGRDLEYVVQVTNGESAVGNPFEADDNTNKAVAARVRFHPTSQFLLEASFYGDKLNEYDAKGKAGPGRTTLLSWGLTGGWEGRKAGLTLEYVWGKVDPSDPTSLTRGGFWAMAWGKFGERWRPYARYEWHDPDTDKGDDTGQILLGGLNVRIEGNVFLKAELDRYTSGAANSKMKGLDWTEVKASLAYGF